MAMMMPSPLPRLHPGTRGAVESATSPASHAVTSQRRRRRRWSLSRIRRQLQGLRVHIRVHYRKRWWRPGWRRVGGPEGVEGGGSEKALLSNFSNQRAEQLRCLQ